MAAALVAGASAVKVGTRFVASKEDKAHPDYVMALVASDAQDTVYTDKFQGTWPIRAPHREKGADLCPFRPKSAQPPTIPALDRLVGSCRNLRFFFHRR